MTDKELKRLGRPDLLELLTQVSRENEELRQKLADAEEKLNCKNIELADAGNIAEAAMRLNNMFTSAQAACDQYLDSVHAMNADTELRCANMVAEAQSRARTIEEDTQLKCDAMVARAEEQSRQFWEDVSRRLEVFYDEHAGLRQLLALNGSGSIIPEDLNG